MSSSTPEVVVGHIVQKEYELLDIEWSHACSTTKPRICAARVQTGWWNYYLLLFQHFNLFRIDGDEGDAFLGTWNWPCCKGDHHHLHAEGSSARRSRATRRTIAAVAIARTLRRSPCITSFAIVPLVQYGPFSGEADRRGFAVIHTLFIFSSSLWSN